MNDEYTGPYALGTPYARIVSESIENDLVCPRCHKELRSQSGYTLHLKKCCPHHLNAVPYEDREPHQPKGVWELSIDDFHEHLKLIDPKAYFITSGEAIRKTERLCADLHDALNGAKCLLRALKAVKGKAKYLETQWEDNRLLLKQKNPRPSSRISQRGSHERSKRNSKGR